MPEPTPLVTATTSRVPSIKGVEVIALRKYVELRHGVSRWLDVLARLSQVDRCLMESAVGVGWYDLLAYTRLLRAVDQEVGKGDYELVSQIGAFMAEQDFNVVFRVFVRVMSPMQIFKLQSRLWSQFYNCGRVVSVPVANDLGVDTTVLDWVVDRGLCLSSAGYVSKIIEFTGGRDVTWEHRECRAAGRGKCVFRFRWR